MVNHYEFRVIFQDIEHQLQENIFFTFLIITFYKIFIKLRSIFDSLEIIYRKLLRHFLSIKSIYIPIFKIWWFFIFIIIIHIFVISFAYRWIGWHNPPLIHFSTINNILSVNNSNWVFLRVLAMIIQKQKENLQDLNDKFLNIFFWRFRKYQQEVMYHFKDTNHDIQLNFLFHGLYKLFSHACYLYL